jgi:RNA polymerase sporulation-specific sigma factor
MTDDSDLIIAANSGDKDSQELLIKKYKYLVRQKAASYYISGGDNEDIIQEGMIGLFKAIRDYKKGHDTTFHTFAALCINRQILTAIKASNRFKHGPLNSFVNIDDNNIELNGSDPESLFINRETTSIFEYNMHKVLSPLEEKVLNLRIAGNSYAEIAKLLDKNVKVVDNTIQRVRRKVEKLIEED